MASERLWREWATSLVVVAASSGMAAAPSGVAASSSGSRAAGASPDVEAADVTQLYIPDMKGKSNAWNQWMKNRSEMQVIVTLSYGLTRT